MYFDRTHSIHLHKYNRFLSLRWLLIISSIQGLNKCLLVGENCFINCFWSSAFLNKERHILQLGHALYNTNDLEIALLEE